MRTGTLRPLASLSAQRSVAVPTVREQDLPRLELERWNGLFAPARTPPPGYSRQPRRPC